MTTFDDHRTQAATGCVQFADLFQDRLLEEPPASSAPAAVRHRYSELAERAGEICAECPMFRSCLYDAVVRHDVAGFVAGTTQRQRSDIRRRLGVVVDPEDFDTFAGATARNRPVDHEEVIRLRRANPDETLESIAQRLGCSLSTVKRHLRRERAARTTAGEVTPMRRSLPTMSQVLATAAQVIAPLRSRADRRAA
jgi:hypothetical protein